MGYYLKQREPQRQECQYACCHLILPMKIALVAVYWISLYLKEVAAFHL
jgi:hypothetical protein